MNGQAAVVDVFCGAGGLTHGLARAGLNVVAGIDCDVACKYPYEANNRSKFICSDVNTLAAEKVTDMYPRGSVRILAGCAPCQPFSTYTQRYGHRECTKEWSLLRDFGRILKGVMPTVVTMENVPQLVGKQPFKEFVRLLEELGYESWSGIVKCEQYGVPQRRRRLVLLASNLGPISMVRPTLGPGEFETVKNWIGDLERLESGRSSQADPIHKSQRLTELNMKRMTASQPDGTWHDWSEELRADCHTKKKGKSYSPVYGRMSWDRPAPTITTQFYNYGSGRFGHPEQDRALSLREGALLQSFPRCYAFVAPGEKVPLTIVGRLIGNAVPVRLGEAIGFSIIEHLEGYRYAG